MHSVVTLLAGLALFGFVNSITPGPNNIMLAASGAAFGTKRTLPHIFGIGFGFAVLVTVVALGLGFVFQKYPGVQNTIKIVGCLYLVYLAYRIGSAHRINISAQSRRPLTFLEAAAFQFANPKAWLMAISGSATFLLPGNVFVATLILCVVLVAVNVPCVLSWAAFGALIARYLQSDLARRTFNAAMAALLLLCVPFILLGRS